MKKVASPRLLAAPEDARRHRRSLPFGLIFAAGIAALLAATTSFAATWTWNGSQGNDHWTNTPNWTPIGPVANDGTADVVFAGINRPTPDMNANWNVHSVTFQPGGTPPFGLEGFTLISSTGSTLTLGAGGITSQGSNSETISHAITLSAAQTWTVGGEDSLSIAGAINNGGNLLTINFSGGPAFGSADISGSISGSGGLTKNGAGGLVLTSGTGASNTYSGTTTVNAGTLTLGPAGAISTTVIPGLLNVGGTLLSNGSERIANSATVNIFSTGAWNLYASNSSETITNLNIGSTGSAGGGLVTTGDGTLTILGSLTMTGATVNTTGAGMLSLGGNLTTNGSAITASISSQLNLGGGVRTFTIADGAAPNDLEIAGVVSNGAIIKTGPGTLRLGVANTYAAGTTLNAGTILIGNDAALGTGLLTGNGGTLRPDGAARTLANPLSGSFTLDCAFDVTLNNSANLNGNITKNGAGALIFAQAATFDGLTINTGIVRIDAPVTFTGGLTNAATLLFGTQTTTVGGAGLNNQGAMTLAGGTLAVANMTNSGSFVFDGGTLNTTALVNNGTFNFLYGTLGITGPAGLTIGSSSPLGSTASLSTGAQLNVTNTLHIDSAGRLTNVGGNVLAGNVQLDAGGRWTVTDGIQSVGTGLVNHGTLVLIDTTINGPVTSPVGSTVTVVGGVTFNQSFSGAGQFFGPGTATFNGGFHPGDSPATVNFQGSATLGGGNTLAIELGGITPGARYDQVQVAGQLLLGGTLAVSYVNGFTPVSGNSFDILDWGTLSGTFSSLSLPTLGAGLSWNTAQLYTTGVLSVAATVLAGDYNGNGIVDAADYTVWRDKLGSSTTLPNDTTPGSVTQADYDVWKSNFGNHAGSGAGANAAVPEPATLLMLLVGMLTLCCRRQIAVP